MAFVSELRALGASWPVREFHWAITQSTEHHNCPTDFMQGGQLHLVLDGLHHPLLDAWMADPDKRVDGSFVVLDAQGARFRTFAFTQALCVSQGLHFSSTGHGRTAATMSLLITAESLVLNGELELSPPVF